VQELSDQGICCWSGNDDQQLGSEVKGSKNDGAQGSSLGPKLNLYTDLYMIF
jgi:hypothetical protein